METSSDLVSMVTNSKLSSIAGKQLLLNRPTEEYQYPMIDFYFKKIFITHWYNSNLLYDSLQYESYKLISSMKFGTFSSKIELVFEYDINRNGFVRQFVSSTDCTPWFDRGRWWGKSKWEIRYFRYRILFNPPWKYLQVLR